MGCPSPDARTTPPPPPPPHPRTRTRDPADPCSKENEEFSEAIIKDLQSLGIRPDKVSHTSDHFDVIIEYARKLVRDGNAYMDNTPVDEMRAMRTAGTPSQYRYVLLPILPAPPHCRPQRTSPW